MHSARSRARAGALLLLGALAVAACARRSRVGAPPAGATPIDSIARVAIALASATARLSTTSLLSIVDGSTGSLMATSGPRVQWMARPLETDAIELVRDNASPLVFRRAPVVLRADERTGMLLFDGRRFRGSITLIRQGEKLLAVNHVAIEDYLKGVVALEIGTRSEREKEAVAAQAVSARSYTYARIAARRRDLGRLYDLVADVNDQAYAGFDSEVQIATEQVEATRGLVLRYGNRIIEAVYSSACGGATADAGDVWAFGPQPYLKSVSDSIPGGRGSYCDIAPRPAWSAALTSPDLIAGLDTYLRNYVSVAGRVTWVDSISVKSRSATGRITAISIAANTGKHEVTGDRIRFVLRPPNGAILRSALFDINAVRETGAGVVRVEASGRGYGHGVGLCQWGAIGRARAGQGFREILTTYFPGTRVERIAEG